MRWRRREPLVIFCDAALRTDLHAVGLAAIVMDLQGVILACWSERREWMSNNAAEYAAVHMALQQVYRSRRLQPRQILICTDSRIVVEQMQGRAAVRAPQMRTAHAALRAAVQQLRVPVAFQHVPRERNRLADALANERAEGRVYVCHVY